MCFLLSTKLVWSSVMSQICPKNQWKGWCFPVYDILLLKIGLSQAKSSPKDISFLEYTVEPHLMDTPKKWTPHDSGHIFPVPNVFYCITNGDPLPLIQPTSLLCILDTFSSPKGSFYPSYVDTLSVNHCLEVNCFHYNGWKCWCYM